LAGSVLVGLAVALVLLGQARQSAADAASSTLRARENEAEALAAAKRADASACLANDRAYASDLSPDGRQLAVAVVDRAIRVWDADTGMLTHTLRGHVQAVTAVCFSSDGCRLFSGSQDQTVRVWHAGSGQPLVILVEPDETTTIAVDANGAALASAGPAGVIGVRQANPYTKPPSPPGR
jgi:WD40 repeat protein